MLLQKKFDARKFVDDLLATGNNEPCDDTSESFNANTDLPPFYDEEKYKKGQKFYYKHKFALYLTKMTGLIATLSISRAREILVFTRMSDSTLKSYRRYTATIFHMCVWYEDDFRPGSELWQSLAAVRHMHNHASNRHSKAKNVRISQQDMALTQFGFMGLALVRREQMGIYHTSDDEWSSFIHLWRVVGYLLGIEDRYNICRESVEETTEICRLLITEIFLPEMEKRDEDFLSLTSYLLEGLWYFNCNVDQSFMNLCYNAMTDDDKGEYCILESTSKRTYFMLETAIYLLRYSIWRTIFNSLMNLSIWTSRYLPVTAMWRFGRQDADVQIFKAVKS